MILWIGSCAQTTESDQPIMSEPELIEVLIDIHLLEVKLSKLGVKKDSMRKIYNRFEKGILEDKGFDKEIYNRSFEHYMANPVVMENIYSVVVDSLNFREQKATLVKMNNDKKEKQAKDSILREIRKKAKKDTVVNDSTKTTLKSKEKN